MFSLAAMAIFFGFFIGYSGTIERNLALWGGVAVLGMTCAVPILQYAARPKEYDALQPALVFAFVAFLAYGLGALYATAHNTSGHDPVTGLLMAVIGIMNFMIGYNLPGAASAKSLASRLPSWRPERAIWAGLICVLVGLVGNYIYFQNGEYFAYTSSTVLDLTLSPISFIREFLLIGLAILAIASLGFGDKPRGRFAVLLLAAGVLALLLPTGIRYNLLYVVASVGVAWHYYRRPIRIGGIVLGILFVVWVLYPIGEMYRSEYHSRNDSSIASVPAVLEGMSKRVLAMNPQSYVDLVLGGTYGRFDLASPTSAVKDIVPQELDYQKGMTFASVALIFIPRPLWVDKPVFDFQNEVGRLSGVLAPEDFRTSYKYGFVGENYLNFGNAGLIFGMLLYGLFFRLLHRWLIGDRRPNETGVLLYSLIIVTLVTIESPLGPSLGGFLRDALAAIAVLWLTGSFSRRATNNVERIVDDDRKRTKPA